MSSMDWLRRGGRQTSPAAPPRDPSLPPPVERTSAGLAALFEGLSEDRSHAILDLGPASDSSLKVYGRYARWVRFCDIVGTAASPDGWDSAVNTLPSQPEHPYDLIFAWDVLDRLNPADRPQLIARLVEVTAPSA